MKDWLAFFLLGSRFDPLHRWAVRRMTRWFTP